MRTTSLRACFTHWSPSIPLSKASPSFWAPCFAPRAKGVAVQVRAAVWHLTTASMAFPLGKLSASVVVDCGFIWAGWCLGLAASRRRPPCLVAAAAISRSCCSVSVRKCKNSGPSSTYIIRTISRTLKPIQNYIKFILYYIKQRPPSVHHSRQALLTPAFTQTCTMLADSSCPLTRSPCLFSQWRTRSFRPASLAEDIHKETTGHGNYFQRSQHTW